MCPFCFLVLKLKCLKNNRVRGLKVESCVNENILCLWVLEHLCFDIVVSNVNVMCQRF